jgi:hypothetical protein
MKKLLVIISLILGITAVNAQQAATQDKSGLKPYVGVEVGSSNATITNFNISQNISLGTMFGVNAGLMFNQYFGAEVFYNDLGSNDSVSFNSYGILAKAQYTFNASALSIYGKLGFGNISNNHDVTDGSTIAGLGLGYQFMPQLQGTIGFRSQLDSNSTSNSSLSFNIFGLGLNYSF